MAARDADDSSSDPRLPGVFAQLWAAVWRWRRRTLLALALLVLAKLAAVTVPLLLKAIVDRFSGPGGLAADVTAAALGAASAPSAVHALVLIVPVFLLFGYALLRFAGTLFTELRDLVFARVLHRTVVSFAERTFAHLLALSPRFHVQRNTGALIRDVERGTLGIATLLRAGLFTVVPTAVEFVAVLAVMAAGYSLWFTLVIVVTFFVYGAYTMAMTERRVQRQRAVNELDSRASGRLVDSLLNYETVKTHGREAFERAHYAGVLAQWVEGSVANQRALSLLHIGQGAIIAAGVAAVMLLAAEQTARGVMTVGDLVLVNNFIIQICLPLNALGFVFREAKDALVNAEKLFALLDVRAEVEDRPSTPPLALRGGAVAFEHVDFGYEPARQILFDVSLAIAAGQTLAVVGGSGSGKSTLARLLLRLYDVNGGRITLDGQDLRGVQLASLREAIGVVPQDTVLFNDTIAHNIGYGRAGAGMVEIIEAAKAAQLHEFILSLPAQYETVVGERGLKLSGGEKQRIAIARAFLKNPPLLIFDEATSALDTRAERAIQGELDRVAEGRTTLVIAHLLSTIVHADEIVVMDRGRIVERGRHEALLEQDGLYAQLWNLQRQQQHFERLERALARQPVNLAALVANAIDALRAPIEARAVRLYTDMDFDNASVTGDPSTLAQALHDLCMAALQATPVGGRMELKLERADAQARLTVSDGRAGNASAPARLPMLSLVKPGEPVEAPPLDPLRLRSIIERQGGRFAIEPPASTHGLSYVVELPLRAVAAPTAQAASAPAEGPAAARVLDGLLIMAIDDHEDAREALCMLLELEGARVLAYAGARAALDWLAARPAPAWPRLMLCDISLGGDEDGYAVMREVRRLEAERGVPLGERLPAVALTGHAQPGDRIRALMAGFQVHLAKPVEPAELVSTLAALAGRGGRTEAA